METPVEEKTRYEAFAEKAHEDISSFKEKLSEDGTYEYMEQVLHLQKLSNKMSQGTLTYLFGDMLGEHLFRKFVIDHNRNLLPFLSSLSSNYRFFLLHELKNNDKLFIF